MAILKANANGTSNAVAGDYVVTGGGVFQKTSNGSIPVTNAKGENLLKDLIGVVKTGNSALVDTAFNMLSTGNTINGSSNANTGYTAPDKIISNVSPTGIVTVEGYDPSDYSGYSSDAGYASSTSSSGGISNVLGFVMLGLVGIALLDKFMGGK